jgi:hypothetical protein
MRNILLFSGTVLLALVMQGCATTASYKELKDRLVDYQPVDDAKLDGLARPFVTAAFQTKADVEKASAEIEGSPIEKLLGNEKPENAAKAYRALAPEQRDAIDKWLAARTKADSTRLENLGKQLADLALAGGRLALEITDAANGGGGGAAGLLGTGMNALGEKGQKVKNQVETATQFCEVSAKLISDYETKAAQVREAKESNTRKAQS